MKIKTFAYFFLALCAALSSATLASPFMLDGLYINTFGDPTKPALIFIHGGPGYHSWDFELTTAQALADQDYFVVVYDQRGQGRSVEALQEDFKYRTYADDIAKIIDHLGIENPVLLGHSHGGVIATKFDEYYPGRAHAIILISAPMNFWGTMYSLFNNCADQCEQCGDFLTLDELAFVYSGLSSTSTINPSLLPYYVNEAFELGIRCGLYDTKTPTPNAQALYRLIQENPLTGPLSGQTTACMRFMANEDYVHINLLEHVKNKRSLFYGIYGDEDGLFSAIERAALRHAFEPSKFRLLEQASHMPFLDQQAQFFEALEKFISGP